MNPTTDTQASAERQRRVRRTAGLLAGGAVVATSALALPALATTDESAPVAAAPSFEPTPAVFAVPTTTATTSTVPAPSPADEFAATWDSWSPEQRFLFQLWISTPEERAQILRFLSPPPPPPPPAPKPKPAPAPKPAPKAAPAPRPQAAVSGGGSAPGGYLACVRQHESGGRYNINTGNGYYGAYQFLPRTWNATAQRAGRSDLVGVLPSNASPADQDAMAQALYSSNGRQPWAGNGC
jgi:hypothetical protein